MTFCLLAVSLAAGFSEASAADGAVTHLDLQSPAVMLGELNAIADTSLENIGRAIVDPERFSAGAGLAGRSHVKLLPAAPAAVAMTLLGFFCVSFARDRRTWLALAGGLICLGHAGTLAAPQLMRRICSRTTQQAAQQSDSIRPCVVSAEPRLADQSIGCVTLLHKLAGIPDAGCETKTRASSTRYCVNGSAAGEARSSAPMAAIAAHVTFANTMTARPADTAPDVVCFSPAFIFSNLSRSPPAFA
ncbi:MAG: hypothetical protein IH624_13745 [Phycisphaerae bacterium]|nr:hypothetical protein [Phycisphaerae bacterium]